MAEFDVLLGEGANEFLEVADEKTERICREKQGFLAENPYPGRGRGDKEKLPIDAHRDRFRLHIGRTFTALYTVLEDRKEVRVLEIITIDEAHKRYGIRIRTVGGARRDGSSIAAPCNAQPSVDTTENYSVPSSKDTTKKLSRSPA